MTFWSAPSIFAASAPPPICVTTLLPAGPSTDLKESPCLVR
jgi:hypothetical protein